MKLLKINLNNNIRKNKNDNMEGVIRSFGDIFNISDCHSVCSAGNSGDLLVKFIDATLPKETLINI